MAHYSDPAIGIFDSAPFIQRLKPAIRLLRRYTERTADRVCHLFARPGSYLVRLESLAYGIHDVGADHNLFYFSRIRASVYDGSVLITTEETIRMVTNFDPGDDGLAAKS
jgi:hypothetical protein